MPAHWDEVEVTERSVGDIRAPHTLLGGPLDVLAFGEGSTTSRTWLPRCDVMWAAPRWLPLGGPHPFEAGPGGLRFLAYGQRDPRDVCFYPRSQKVRLRGIGPVTFRVEQVGYWEGEEG